jgi:hypothetical protein
MKNPLEMLKEIKSVLGIELSEDVQDTVQETKLAQMTLENGTIIEAEDFAPDAEVFIVTEEDKIALPVGEYTLEDGMVLIVEAEGIIKEIKEATSEEVVEEEVEASETEVEVEAAEEEMSYATKEELAEVKSMIEEIKAMIKDKEEMAAVEEQVKEELSSTPAAAPLKHNPEGEAKTKKVTFGQNRPQSIQDRVFARIANIQK